MKILLFNGSLDNDPQSAINRVISYFNDKLEQTADVNVLQLANANIPIFSPDVIKAPEPVRQMNEMFTSADAHIWFTPLYHGSMTGAMKNYLDWLEFTRTNPLPYLTNKYIGLVCMAEGLQAMQGITTMDQVAKSLRAWILPFSVPIARPDLFDSKNEITPFYSSKFDLLAQLLLNTRQTARLDISPSRP